MTVQSALSHMIIIKAHCCHANDLILPMILHHFSHLYIIFISIGIICLTLSTLSGVQTSFTFPSFNASVVTLSLNTR